MEYPERDWFKDQVPTEVFAIWDKWSALYQKYSIRERITNRDESRGNTHMFTLTVSESLTVAISRGICTNGEAFALPFNSQRRGTTRPMMLGFSISVAVHDPRYYIDLGVTTSGTAPTTEETYWGMADAFIAELAQSFRFNA